MIEDRLYCMNSFLMFRTVIDKNRCFSEKYYPFYVYPPTDRYPVHNAGELLGTLQEQILNITKTKKVALALSGGIDSAILAKFLPAGTMTYTFRCISENSKLIDETKVAAKYAEICGLDNKIIDISFQDMQELALPLMEHKGAPIHSIEVQIYKAASQAKSDGADTLIFGESADVLYGGMSKLLAKDWTFGEFVSRYSYIMPYYVLKKPQLILEPYIECTVNGFADVHKFNSTVFYQEAINSYYNACAAAGIDCFMPFSNTFLDDPLDYGLIRSGENKYLVREVFRNLYTCLEPPEKIPMQRPMDEWLASWKGPIRAEFWPNCTKGMTGDQKWLVWALEKFLNLCDEMGEGNK